MLDAVRNAIEALETWVLILDNADDLSLFGVRNEDQSNTSTNLFGQVPRGSSGTVLWTSRDERIVGTIVGPRRGIEVGPMTSHESSELLGVAGNLSIGDAPSEATALLHELERLPLAISQAGAYIRRTSMPAQEYLALLKHGKTRWEILKAVEPDRHRRPLTPNSILETWAMTIERLRDENNMAYRMMHVISYMNHRDIPFDIFAKAGKLGWEDKGEDDDNYSDGYSDSDGAEAGGELEVQQAITRLKEFSFLAVLKTEESGRTYEMHKLVHEAVRYQLRTKKTSGFVVEGKNQNKHRTIEGWVYFSGIAVQVMYQLFPVSEPETWRRCEQYLAHAMAVGEWAKGCGKQVEAAQLLSRVSGFLHDRRRWREMETVAKRALQLRREILGEKHPDTFESMASLAITYHGQGHYAKAETLKVRVLELRREVLGEGHPGTIESLASLAVTYHQQGRYGEAEEIFLKVLDLRKEALGEKHPDILESMASLSTTYHAQGRYDKAEGISVRVLNLRQEVLGDKHPDTIESMASLAMTYYAQGHYDEAEPMAKEVLDLRQRILGEKHPDTIRSMADVAAIYQIQGHSAKAKAIYVQVLDLREEVLGEEHPETLRAARDLATSSDACGRPDEALYDRRL